VAVSIFTALLPGLAERWNDDDRSGVRELFSRGVRDTSVVMIPAAAGYVVLAGPIVALFAAYGAVGEADVDLLARTLAAFAVGLPFFSVFQLLTRTYYAGHDSRTPALVNIAVGGVNLVADVVLAFVFDLGVPGLALGHATSYAVGSVVLFVLLRPRLDGVDGPRIATTLVRTTAAAAMSAGAAWAASEVVDGLLDAAGPGARLVQVSAGIVAGVLVFWVTAAIVRVREVDEVRQALLARFRR
jgi:putative peptidoglycan lipid II flippase